MKLIQNNNLNAYELFFCERILELIHKNSIDSHRVRVMNTKLIINELVHLCDGGVYGKIHDFKTVQSCLDETIKLLKDDDVFICSTVSKDFFITFLQEAVKGEKTNDKDVSVIKNLAKIKNITQVILVENANYGVNLLEKISHYINNPLSPKDPYITLENIDKLTGSLITELVGTGYHKSYLSIKFNRIFAKKVLPFSSIKDEISRLFAIGEKEYRVWFKFYASESICKSLKSFSRFIVEQTIKQVNPTQDFVKAEFVNFNKFSHGTRFIAIDVKAFDYYSALYKAKTVIAEGLDILNLGFGNQNSNIFDRAYVVDLYQQDLARFHELRYSLDGKYNYGEPLFETIHNTIPTLLEEKYIEQDSKEKIKSAFHYLRLGNEAMEIEHKIINYWFGLEYLFSNPTDTSFRRIITFFPKLQAIPYLKTNVIDIYDRAKIINNKQPLKHISLDDYSCFKHVDFYKELCDSEDVYKISPLLSYRAWFLKNRFFGSDAKGKRKDLLDGHIEKLEQQIRRIYSVRNEIVHEAQYNTNSESLTSNLKYYLIFSLSVILDYFLKYEAQGVNMTSIEDFFQLQELKFDYFKKENFPLEKIMDIPINRELLGG